jgi:hypothetical protein
MLRNRLTFLQDSNILGYSLIAAGLSILCWNIINFWTIQTPWIDDTWTVDLAVNLYFKGEFTTTAWKDIRGGSLLSTALTYGWFKLVGFSFFKYRFLGVIWFLSSFYFIAKILKIILKNNYILSVSLLFFILNSSRTITWIFYNGRMDGLIVFLVLVNVYLILKYNKNRKVKYIFLLFFVSCLLGTSYALPSIFFVLYILLFLLCIKKLSVLQLILSGFGMLSGVLFHLGFHYLIGGYGMLRKILVTTISFSKNGVLLINKLVDSGLLNDSLKNLLRLDFQSAPFSKNNLGYFHFPENNTFITLVIVLAVFVFVIRPLSRKNMELFYSLVFVALIPVYMNIVGRFLLYYQWMFLIPLFILIVYYFSKFDLISYKILLVGILVINLRGTRVFTCDSNNQVRSVSDICSSICATDIVYCDYLFYYQSVSVAKKVYLYQNLKGQNLDLKPSKIVLQNRNFLENRNFQYAIQQGYKLSKNSCYENSKDTFFLYTKR